MRKRKLKILFAAIAASLMLCLPLCASAAEVAPEDTEIAECEAEDTEIAEGEENVFALAYGTLRAHSTELLSALAFIGTLIVGFAYKKGLLPLISKTLAALGGAVADIKEQTERSDASAESVLSDLGRRLGEMEISLDKFAGSISDVERSVGTLSASDELQSSMRKILYAQIDMLYEIFMSSSLPAYQKESVGERISTMKRMLEENGENAK